MSPRAPQPPGRPKAVPGSGRDEDAWRTGGATQASSSRSERLSLRLPVQPSSVGLGRRAAAQFGEEVALEAAALWSVRVAVSEAITNVVLHAHPSATEGPRPHFVLLAEADATGCAITITDEGVGLQARDDSPGMGLGLGLIARSCDELELGTGPRGGTSLRMTFLRR